MDYFKNCNSIQEVKQQYKTLVFKYHTDINQDIDINIIKEINIQYDLKLKEAIKNHNKNIKNTNKHIKFNDLEENKFKSIINKIVTFTNINIDIIGSWIWVYGETYPIKENLKKLGFKWSRNRKKWYFTFNNTNYNKKGYRSKYKSYKEIKNNYGCLSIDKEKQKQLN